MKIAIGRPGFATPILFGAAFAVLAGPAAAQPPQAGRPTPMMQYHGPRIVGQINIPLMDESGTVRAIMAFPEGPGGRHGPIRRITFMDAGGSTINLIPIEPRPAGSSGPPIAEIGPSRRIDVDDEPRGGLAAGRSDSNLLFLQNRIDVLEARLNEVIRRVSGRP